MKVFSDACEYALRAAVWMAQRPGEPHKVRDIAEGTKSAPGYLVKVLQLLAKAGILSAQRGSHGGFTLERDPARLSVLEVVSAVDPIERIHRCPLGLSEHRKSLCPLHRRMDASLESIERSFADTTVAALLNDELGDKSRCGALTVSAPRRGGKDRGRQASA